MSELFEKELSDIQQIYGLLTELSKQKDLDTFINIYNGLVSDESIRGLEKKYNRLSNDMRYKHPEIGEIIALKGEIESFKNTIRNVKGPLIGMLYSHGAKNPNDATSIVKYAENITNVNKVLEWLSEWNDSVMIHASRCIETLPTPEDLSLVKHKEPLRNIVNTIFKHGYVSEKSMKKDSQNKLEMRGIISADEKGCVFLTNKGVNLYQIFHANDN